MPDWAEQVLTWDEVRRYIEEGTVEALGKLRRSEQQLATYRTFMDKVSPQFKLCLRYQADHSVCYGQICVTAWVYGVGEGRICQRGRLCQDLSSGTNQQSQWR
jgi:hypothetical protein